jgi:DNA-binding CsgD family transcriptional regulator
MLNALGLECCGHRLNPQLKAAIMNTINTGTGEVKGLWMSGLAPEWMALYVLEFATEDVLASHIAAAPIARFYATNLDLSAELFRATRFYQQWVKPQGVAYACGAIVMREGQWLTQLVLQRVPNQPPFTRHELGIFNRLMPHLQRAIQMRQRFRDLQMGQNFLTSGLDVLAMPTILIDELGQVAHCNRSAQQTLSGRRDLWIENGHLCSRTAAHTIKLNLEITKAIQASRGSASDAPGVVLLPRTGKKNLMLLISPLHASGAAKIRGGALLFAFDPDMVPSTIVDLVRRLFDLSQAEAALAVSLCSGLTLDEASVERGTSLQTVRTQLKSIFNKTGTNRQADLISVLLSSPAYFLSPNCQESR